jgi:hypothetical protein
MGSLQVIEFVTLDGVMQGLHGPDDKGGFQHHGWGVEYADDIQFRSASSRSPQPVRTCLGDALMKSSPCSGRSSRTTTRWPRI